MLRRGRIFTEPALGNCGADAVRGGYDAESTGGLREPPSGSLAGLDGRQHFRLRRCQLASMWDHSAGERPRAQSRDTAGRHSATAADLVWRRCLEPANGKGYKSLSEKPPEILENNAGPRGLDCKISQTG